MKSDLVTVADRVISVIMLFNTRKTVTVRIIAESLNCSYSTALRYLQAVSLKLPIMATNESRAYHEAIEYQLLERKI